MRGYPGFEGFSTAWGVEDLSKTDRFAKGVNAGLDQFGGADETGELVAAVQQGKITAERLNQSAQRILKVKFAQGLFDNPFVDASAADTVVGAPASVAAGRQAQGQAIVVLENKKGLLPLKAGTKVFLRGVSADAATAHGLMVVNTPEAAAVAQAEDTPYDSKAPLYPIHYGLTLQAR